VRHALPAAAAAFLAAAACQRDPEPPDSVPAPAILRAADSFAELAQDRPGALSLTFAWPASGSVRVRETVRKAGQDAELSYRLTWGAEAGQEGFVLRHEELRFESLGGTPLSEDASQGLLQAGQWSEAMLPGLRIGADGSLRELLSAGRPSAEESARLEALASNAGRTWACWVGCWQGARVLPGAEARDARSALLGPGAEIPAELLFRAGEIESSTGRPRIRLTLEVHFDPEALTALTPPLQEDWRIGRAVRVDHYEVLTDPATLMPQKALRRSEVEIFDEAGVSRGSRKEQHLYVFEWPAN